MLQEFIDPFILEISKTLSWTDTKVQSGVQYKYTLKAVNAPSFKTEGADKVKVMLWYDNANIKPISAIEDVTIVTE